ncbi:hypothetical protein BSL78_08851 [Apostichopus japonicus]|uniref:Uncharacterized protein n=1 Tax=Stichopus japonicus TaxID=307972 RepID=A0A2G8L1T1_STIJA|nr:hypothetical protein BSL78_08851 [Apostichopus japonicus]
MAGKLTAPGTSSSKEISLRQIHSRSKVVLRITEESKEILIVPVETELRTKENKDMSISLGIEDKQMSMLLKRKLESLTIKGDKEIRTWSDVNVKILEPTTPTKPDSPMQIQYETITDKSRSIETEAKILKDSQKQQSNSFPGRQCLRFPSALLPGESWDKYDTIIFRLCRDVSAVQNCDVIYALGEGSQGNGPVHVKRNAFMKDYFSMGDIDELNLTVDMDELNLTVDMDELNPTFDMD